MLIQLKTEILKKKYKLKAVAMVTGTLIGISIGKPPKNISSLRGVALSTCVTDRQTDRPKTICLPPQSGGRHNEYTKI